MAKLGNSSIVNGRLISASGGDITRMVGQMFGQFEQYFYEGSQYGVQLVAETMRRELVAGSKKGGPGWIPWWSGATAQSTKFDFGGFGGRGFTASGIARAFTMKWTTPYAGYIYPWGGAFVPYGNKYLIGYWTNADRSGTPKWGYAYIAKNRQRLVELLKSRASSTVKSRLDGQKFTKTRVIYF